MSEIFGTNHLEMEEQMTPPQNLTAVVKGYYSFNCMSTKKNSVQLVLYKYQDNKKKDVRKWIKVQGPIIDIQTFGSMIYLITSGKHNYPIDTQSPTSW